MKSNNDDDNYPNIKQDIERFNLLDEKELLLLRLGYKLGYDREKENNNECKHEELEFDTCVSCGEKIVRYEE